MEQADGVAVAIVAAKAVRAHHFGERVALMRGRHVAASAHFGEADAIARLGELPGGFGAREAAADDVNVVAHLPFPLTCVCRAAHSAGSRQDAMGTRDERRTG